MSKKCCGLIYKDTDTVCKICGKPLKDGGAEDEYNKILDEANRVADDVLGIKINVSDAEIKPDVVASEEKADSDEAVEIGEDSADDMVGADEADKAETADTDEAAEDSVGNTDEAVEIGEDSAEDTDGADEDSDNDVYDSGEDNGRNKPKPKNRPLGIITLIVAILGLAGVIFCVIVFVVSPAYKYTSAGMDGKSLTYSEISTSSDATAQDALLTPTDIETGIYFDDTATAGDASPSDAAADESDGLNEQETQE